MNQMPTCEPVRSEFADDPEMQALVELFVAGMAEKIVALRESSAAGELEAIQVQLHQLKGAGAGYGFPELSELAEETGRRIGEQQDPNVIASAVETFVAYLDRLAL